MAYPTATYRAATSRGERPFLGRVQRTAMGTFILGLSAVAAAGAILTSISVFSARSSAAFRGADPTMILAKTLPAPTVFAIAHRAQFPAADEMTTASADITGSLPPLADRFPAPNAFVPLLPTTVKTVSFTPPRSQEVPLPPAAPVGKAAAAKAVVAAKSDVPAMFRRDQEPTSSPTVSSYALASVEPTAVAPPSTVMSKLRSLLPGQMEDVPEADRRTAVYDIVGATVHMPNGTKLVAHSGYGPRLDNPSHIKVKNWGPTPPNVYRLSMREALFHGVQAIRLNPIDESQMFGRDGMLAHTYMLGPRGDSNGCISFQDYPKFLAAFQRGEVDRIVVVPDLRQEPLRMARAKGRLADTYASAR